MKKLFTILALVSSIVLNAQSYGRVTVYSNAGQQFLISFNGVRWSNNYQSKAVLEYAEDNDYKVRLWFPRNTSPINFNITSTPGYETIYILEKDQYDAYVLTLESKFKFNANPNPVNPTPTVAPTPTAPTTPSVVVITEMKDADFKAKLASVKNESFDDKKMTKLNFLFKDEFVSSAQAAELVKLFSFDSKKVDAGKALYKRTVDKKNYYKVVDVMTFDSYKKDLQDWIMKNP
ncbi:MAG: DUF4476 domain-containing protein [Sphingobacteriaceae bacterium]|nr:DUF4476 domain-containing protein [Sphingobacteriaceae bacterium]